MELGILKEYNLVSSNITLEDVLYSRKPGGYGQLTKNVTGENFVANLSLIFFTGIGIGIGLGMKLRFVNWFSQFFAFIAGAGLVICYDISEDTLYTLFSFLLPVIVGYLAGFVGIIMFAVLPGTFYSNFVVLGMTSFTVWVQLFIG